MTFSIILAHVQIHKCLIWYLKHINIKYYFIKIILYIHFYKSINTVILMMYLMIAGEMDINRKMFDLDN